MHNVLIQVAYATDTCDDNYCYEKTLMMPSINKMCALSLIRPLNIKRPTLAGKPSATLLSRSPRLCVLLP